MSMLWVVLLLALADLQIGCGFPVRTTPYTYPHDGTDSSGSEDVWWLGRSGSSNVYAALPALALVITAVGLLFGCTWCYRHKDCKLFTASASHLHDGSRRSQPPDSGFVEAVVVVPAAAHLGEDNNNGPISLREMQNIANNNALGYIATEDESRDRERAASRESRVEFEPLPAGIGAGDPLAHYSQWLRTPDENFSRNKLQYLREIGRGWFGRIVEGEIESSNEEQANATVAVKILSQNASLIEKARFLDEVRMYRELRHENVLRLLTYCLNEEPWLLIFDLCSMDLQQYLTTNRHKMAILNESGVPLRLKCDVAAGLSYMHSQGFVYGDLYSGSVFVHGDAETARALLGRYHDAPADDVIAAQKDAVAAPELRRTRLHTTSSDVWSLGALLWEVCSWGSPPVSAPPLPEPALPCPYRSHLYQVMQLCWHTNPDARPTSSQVHVLLNHLYTSHQESSDFTQDDGYSSSDFEERWQRLKPNTIPKLDEHIAIVHAPSTSVASHFTGSDQDFANTVHTVQDTLSLDIDTAVSRSSSIMSDRDPLSVHVKSESLTNLHGSLEDVRNIYLTHSENAIPEDQEQNPAVFGSKDHDDMSEGSEIHRVDPWLKDIITDSQDDVSYYRDVSDVIKNLDNILNSEKTSSSESSHQASPSRDALTLDCKKDCLVQSSLVKSPGISNFQSILEATPEYKDCEDEQDITIEDVDRETIGTLSHSFERHSETNSQYTDDTLSPDTPINSNHGYAEAEIMDPVIVQDSKSLQDQFNSQIAVDAINNMESNDIVLIPNLRDLCLFSVNASLSDLENEQVKCQNEDCFVSCDKEIFTEPLVENIDNFSLSKSVDNMPNENQNTYNIISEQIIEEVSDLRKNIKIVDDLREDAKVQTSNIKNMEEKTENKCQKIVEQTTTDITRDISKSESDTSITINKSIQSNDSTVYMDLIDEASRKILSKENLLDNNVKDIIENCDNLPEEDDNCTLIIQNNSTIYLDLPNIISETDKLLNCERMSSIQDIYYEKNNFDLKGNFSSSTPKATSESIDMSPLENTCIVRESMDFENTSEMITPNYGHGVVLTKLEQKVVPDNFSPFDSPTKSQPTDTYDENSSIVLGPFDYSSLELFKVIKGQHVDCIEIPKDELFAFSSNFTEINLETPSPLRDGNFLNEVPDIYINDCDNESVKYMQGKRNSEEQTECKDIQPSHSSTEERPHTSQIVSENREEPSTTINNAGRHTMDVNPGLGTLQAEMIKLNLTTRLAMAENENNLNIEQSGPMSIEDYSHDNVIVSNESRDEEIPNVVEIAETKSLERGVPTNLECQDVQKTERNPENILEATTPETPVIDEIATSTLKALPENDKIEVSITTKLTSPLTVDVDLTSESVLAGNGHIENVTQVIQKAQPQTDTTSLKHVSDLIQAHEAYLAVNTADREEIPRLELTLDDECVQALRNELELKLPLAQGACEPCDEPDVWTGELPPPPELVVNYPGALSPIVEETRQQLNAYDNQMQWDLSESSESYPEPCNDSTAEVTDILTAVNSAPPLDHTYNIDSERTQPSVNINTYTVQKDATTISKELSMSADSLNVNESQDLTSKRPDTDTYIVNKDDDCEKLSQVSPFILSPTTESTVPEPSENGTGISTLSKATAPSNVKSSKPSETQCLSKATSIDSWCSNDTLFNVEDNFDDLAMDSDVPHEFNDNYDKDIRSNSTGTLTDHDTDKDISHCSTYIVHDSKSDPQENITPDSITAHHTYTKPKIENDKNSSTLLTKSEINDSSTKNTRTKDLAYETLISGCNSNIGSHSNCTTDIFSGKEEPWKSCQPVEMVRQSTHVDEFVNITSPFIAEDTKEESASDSPKLNSEPLLRKLDSVEITCLNDAADDEHYTDNLKYDAFRKPPNQYCHFRNIANSVTSTPIITDSQSDTEDVEAVPLVLPTKDNSFALLKFTLDTSNYMNTFPNFQTFMHSAELRPQDMSTLETDTNNPIRKTLSLSDPILHRYSDFEDSAIYRAQGSNSQGTLGLSHSASDGFSQFANSAKCKPQDLSEIVESPLSKVKQVSSKEPKITEAINFNINLDHGLSGITDGEHSKNNESSSIVPVNIQNGTEISNDVLSPSSLDRAILYNSTNSLSNKSGVEEIGLNSTNTSPLKLNLTSEVPCETEDNEHEQPHSIIITNISSDPHLNSNIEVIQRSDSLSNKIKPVSNSDDMSTHLVNGDEKCAIDDSLDCVTLRYNCLSLSLPNPQSSDEGNKNNTMSKSLPIEKGIEYEDNNKDIETSLKIIRTHQMEHDDSNTIIDINNQQNVSENFAFVNFLRETFEELPNVNTNCQSCLSESEIKLPIVKDSEPKPVDNCSDGESQPINVASLENVTLDLVEQTQYLLKDELPLENVRINDTKFIEPSGVTVATENFLQNEKFFCQFSTYLPLLGDIRFTGPGSDCMSTSFNQESPTDDQLHTRSETEKVDTAAEILKEWDSDSDDSQSSNSSSGEFIWKDGAGHESRLVPTTLPERDQRSNGGDDGGSDMDRQGTADHRADDGEGSANSGDSGSGSGSEGDEVEFVPSSWDCRAAPAKSSLRSLEQAQSENKKRVVFKRQKYHCVYEYPREVYDADALAAPYLLPDYSTYTEWDAASAEEAELGYGQLFGPHDALPPRAVDAANAVYGPDYDDDFFISSSARPFESLCILSSSSQFFPGQLAALKAGALEPRETPLEGHPDDFPAPSSPLLAVGLGGTRAPSLDFTTPDSGVEDITPGSIGGDEKNLPDSEAVPGAAAATAAPPPLWRPLDSGSSSESVSPSSPGIEALGGLRHTRDKLKLDLPPSPHLPSPSPRHNRVFNFITLEKPRRPTSELLDETAYAAPTFSTFGKGAAKPPDAEKAIVLTDDSESERGSGSQVEQAPGPAKEATEGETTVIDSGDEDSGIESSAKTTLQMDTPASDVS